MVPTDPAEQNLRVMQNVQNVAKVVRNRKEVNGNVLNALKERKLTVSSQRKHRALKVSSGINVMIAKNLTAAQTATDPKLNADVLMVILLLKEEKKQRSKVSLKNLKDLKGFQKLNAMPVNLSVRKMAKEQDQEHV
jgi:hypothetical protein